VKTKLAIVLAASLGLAGAACSRAGMGDAVRQDVTRQMEKTRDPIAACYKAALERNCRAGGLVVVQFVSAATSGKFEQVSIVRDDVRDAKLASCVVDAVAAQKLDTPQKTQVAVSSYPLELTPKPRKQ
jgi:hypothetical protein